jgi:putative membrane protein
MPMTDSPSYADTGAEPIVRDHLAGCRTVLANERTFLAYIRTALTLLVAGLTFIRFFEVLVIELLGWVFLPLAVATFGVGLVRYNRSGRFVRRIGLTKYGPGPKP